MDKKPVDDLQFWQDRIAVAKKNGLLHYSVYLANPNIWRKIFRQHKEIFAKEIAPGDSVLDAGCGYGRLAECFDPEQYIGVDFSPDFIALAQKLYPTHVFIQADLGELPFRAQRFDVAVCISIKGMIVANLGNEEWERMAKDLKRVAKKVLILEYGDCSAADEYEVL